MKTKAIFGDQRPGRLALGQRGELTMLIPDDYAPHA